MTGNFSSCVTIVSGKTPSTNKDKKTTIFFGHLPPDKGIKFLDILNIDASIRHNQRPAQFDDMCIAQHFTHNNPSLNVFSCQIPGKMISQNPSLLSATPLIILISKRQ